MIMLLDGEIEKPAAEEVFYDGFLYIICQRQLSRDKTEYSIDVKILNAEYDKPWSLMDILYTYMYVQKVIYEDAMQGFVYNYVSYKDQPVRWEKAGVTKGYV